MGDTEAAPNGGVKAAPPQGSTSPPASAPAPLPVPLADTVVRIDVGGRLFTTTVGMLQWGGTSCALYRVADTALALAAVDGAPAAHAILDRDPAVFEHVLRYLRAAKTGGEALPACVAMRRALAAEADALRLPQLRAALRANAARLARRQVVVAERTTLLANGVAESGHYAVNGRRGAASGVFFGFTPEALERAFQTRLTAVVADLAKTGLVLLHTSTAAVAVPEGVDPKSDAPRIRHIHTVTLTFGPPDAAHGATL